MSDIAGSRNDGTVDRLLRDAGFDDDAVLRRALQDLRGLAGGQPEPSAAVAALMAPAGNHVGSQAVDQQRARRRSSCQPPAATRHLAAVPAATRHLAAVPAAAAPAVPAPQPEHAAQLPRQLRRPPTSWPPAAGQNAGSPSPRCPWPSRWRQAAPSPLLPIRGSGTPSATSTRQSAPSWPPWVADPRPPRWNLRPRCLPSRAPRQRCPPRPLSRSLCRPLRIPVPASPRNRHPARRAQCRQCPSRTFPCPKTSRPACPARRTDRATARDSPQPCPCRPLLLSRCLACSSSSPDLPAQGRRVGAT